MYYTSMYRSPLGPIWMASDGKALIGLWFDGQKYDRILLHGELNEADLAIFATVKQWLDDYFQNKQPKINFELHLIGTAFQREIWSLLLDIPYGKTTTYAALARSYAINHGMSNLPYQAVGQAVGRNPISIIVPCHRVIGKDGKLHGYASGLINKAFLLTLEGQKQFIKA